MMYLSQDIRSALKPPTIYGKQGECVNVISYHGSVAIVENIQGERFPILAELLTGKINKNEQSELELHRAADRIEEKPDTKLRREKRNKSNRGVGKDTANALFT